METGYRRVSMDERPLTGEEVQRVHVEPEDKPELPKKNGEGGENSS